MRESIQTDDLPIEAALLRNFPRSTFQAPSLAEVISQYNKRWTR